VKYPALIFWVKATSSSPRKELLNIPLGVFKVRVAVLPDDPSSTV